MKGQILLHFGRLYTLLALASYASVSSADDAIQENNDFQLRYTSGEHERRFLFGTIGELSAIVRSFLDGNVKESVGVDDRDVDLFHKNPKHYLLRLTSHLSLVLSNSSHLEQLSQPYYFQTTEGAAGLEFSLFGRDESAKVFISLTAQGELLMARVGEYAIPNGVLLPVRPLLGPALGVHYSHTIGGVEPGFSLSLHPETEIGNNHESGNAGSLTIFTKINVGQLISGDPRKFPQITVQPQFKILKRGAAKQDIIDFLSEHASGDFQDDPYWEFSIPITVILDKSAKRKSILESMNFTTRN